MLQVKLENQQFKFVLLVNTTMLSVQMVCILGVWEKIMYLEIEMITMSSDLISLIQECLKIIKLL